MVAEDVDEAVGVNDCVLPTDHVCVSDGVPDEVTEFVVVGEGLELADSVEACDALKDCDLVGVADEVEDCESVCERVGI